VSQVKVVYDTSPKSRSPSHSELDPKPRASKVSKFSDKKERNALATKRDEGKRECSS
jgi:hypothetical protein